LSSADDKINRYSYSKTKGLFGGVSIEGSVIVERQDANASAYNNSATAQMLLTGAVPPPPWADGLIKTLERLASSEPNPKWVKENPVEEPYAFGGMGSSSSLTKKDKKSTAKGQFPPPSWGIPKTSGAYFDSFEDFGDAAQTKPQTPDPPANNDLIDIRDNTTDSVSGDIRATSSGRRMSSPFDTSGTDFRVPTDKFTSPFDMSTLAQGLPPTSSASSSARPRLGRSFSNASASSGMKARAEKLSSHFGNDLDSMRRLTSFGSGSSSKPSTQGFKFSNNPAYDWAGGRRASPAPGTPNDQYDYRDSSAFRFQEVDADLDKAGAGIQLPSGVATDGKPKVLRKTSTLSTNSSDGEVLLGFGTDGGGAKVGRAPSQRFKAELTRKEPDSIGKAVVRFEFQAVEPGDLSMRKGDIVTILEKSESTDDWYVLLPYLHYYPSAVT
jgi:Las17-binding protein actin regulator/SH3 domain